MIQMITAYTTEIDETEDALDEILGQIDPGALKKNNVGIVTCHYDFTQTGFINKLHQKLSFDIIGMTTMASANKHGQSMYALSLTVLTSDDVIFETATTGQLFPSDYREKIKAAYSNTVKKLPGQPSLIFTFFPCHREISGALMHKALSEICDGIPFWGGVSTNLKDSFECTCAFLNENTEERKISMLLMHGPVDPEFAVVSIPAQNIGKTRGIITDSDNCILKKINGIPATTYLENLGVVIQKDVPIITPLMVYYEGTIEPVSVGIHIMYSDGSLLCGAILERNTSVAIGDLSSESILITAREGMIRLLNKNNKNGALFLPCVSRYVMLAPKHSAEIDIIASQLKNSKLPYMMGYSGGEICPVRDENGVLQNRFHNYTFSACVL